MNYDRFVSTAIKQINDKGRTVILRNSGNGSFDPITSTFTDGATTDRSPKGLFTEYNAKEIDGSIIIRGDKKVLIADLSSPPDNSDILIDGTDEYSVINVGVIQPGDTPILYILQVRR